MEVSREKDVFTPIKGMKVDIFNTENKYQIIYADPPWKYADRKCNGACEFHYNSMKLEDIKKLPVNKLADKDCGGR